MDGKMSHDNPVLTKKAKRSITQGVPQPCDKDVNV